MAETVLVTGGTGFVASRCIRELLHKNFIVHTTIRSSGKESLLRSTLNVFDERLKVFVADLTSDAGWDEAVRGCRFVLHIASPLIGKDEGNPDAFALPAQEGTLRILRASVREKVKRVVMTSAAAAARPPLDSGRESVEDVWADPEDSQFDEYRKSKIRAERIAWEFMRSEGGETEFTSILPGAVFGPIMNEENSHGSVQIIDGMLKGKFPLLAPIGFYVVDVRDLAEAHIRAILSPNAAGERFIVAGEFMWMREIAQTLKENLGTVATKVSTSSLPGFVVKLLAPFSSQMRSISPLVHKKFEQSSEKAKRILGFQPRSAVETIVDCANSLRNSVRL
ncbi:NAD-dependent epimerase/dehydratase family protein [Leptospira koniambonensis]|uniref:NAD-dependent epimerase/dehydratase family protein n=1 Tax=Leptospira koniambonensis TaxID=2484950 RepID=UPI003EBBEEB1